MMKFIKNLSPYLLMLLFSLCIISCGDDDDMTEDTKTIADLASETSNLSSLVAALDKVDLVSVVEGEGPFTVFAPTDAAFSAFLTSNGFSNLDEVPNDLLTSVLLNHVVNGTFESGSLNTGYVKTNATESSTGNAIDMYINTSSGVVINGQSNVTTADIAASNGVIHIVDAVIALPTVVTFATADNTFSTLVSALTRSDLTTDFVSILTAEGPYTVFAPTNDAFGDLVAELGITGLADIDVATLDAVLKYHVVSDANVLSTALTDDMTVNTVAGSPFSIDLSNGAEIIDGRDRVSNIIVTDVQATNGVIHVVDKVLLP